MTSALPLAGVRVIELGTVIAGPFAGSLLADLGAEVIKIEPPGKGDIQRTGGHQKNGVGLWWGVASRDKKCITLDLKHAEGKSIFTGLLGKADVLVENYRPGVLDRLGFGWPDVHRINPAVVMLSISGYGRSGPYAKRAGFGKVAEALSGIVNLTGSPDDRPLFVGFSLADTSTGLFGVLGVALALYQRDVRGGVGSHVDAALYEGLMRMLECQFSVEQSTGMPSQRVGTNDPHGWGQPRGGRPTFQSVLCSDGVWLLLRITDEDGLRTAAGGLEGELRAALDTWAARQGSAQVQEALRGKGVDIVPVLDGMSIALDGYLQARGDVLAAHHPDVGDFSVPGHIHPPVANDPRKAFHAATLGEHTHEVLRELMGMKDTDIERLQREGVI